jgi:hypothetical protein
MNHDIIAISILEDRFDKQAGFGTDLVQNIFNKIKEMIGDKITQGKESPLETALDILTPTILMELGFTKLSILYMIAQGVFGVDFVPVFKSIKESIIKMVSSSPTDQISKEEVNQAVEQSFSSVQMKPDVNKLPGILTNIGLNKQSEITVKITKQIIKDAKEMGFYAYADFIKTSGLESIGIFLKSGLMSVLSFIVNCVLKACGLLLGSAAISGAAKTVGVDLPAFSSKPVEPHKIKLIPSNFGSEKSTDGWIENFPLNKLRENIINWSKEVYPELKKYPNYMSIANQSNYLDKVVSTIEKYNEESKTSDIATYIPPMFKSIKDIVDSFLGDVIGKL